MHETSPPDIFDCRLCGACCAFSAEWPRFSLESEAEIAAIPAEMVAEDESGMRFAEGRCAALTGKVGTEVGCSVYAARPHVCRSCMPGDGECRIARKFHGLSLDGLPDPSRWDG